MFPEAQSARGRLTRRYAYMASLLAALLLLAASVSVGAEERAVILIDEEHMQIGRDDEAPSYVVRSSAVIVVDFTAHQFNLWPDPSEPPPDTIGVAVSDTRQYYFSIPAGSRRVELSASMARPLHGSEAWSGLASGERAILTIGKLRVDHARSEEVLRVHWLGLVDAR